MSGPFLEVTVAIAMATTTATTTTGLCPIFSNYSEEFRVT